MERTLLLSVTACAFSVTIFAQKPATPIVLTAEAREKSDSYNAPFIGNERIYRIGYSGTINQNKPNVAYVMRLDGGSPTAEVIVAKPSIPGVVISNTYFYFKDKPWGIFQGWDKETGKVSLFAQAYDPDSFAANGAPFPIGTVPLDAGSYRGVPLRMETYPSPDQSKLLIYFDGIQSGNIKLAMCWVMDDAMQPVWNGMYRLPVQAYGAETNVNFFNDGQVAVDVEAIVLDADNTREKSDGSVSAKVDKSYINNRSITLYVLHGETFLMWDGEFPNGVQAENAKLLNLDGVWHFLASTVTGKGKERRAEWIVGTMDGSFEPAETARGNGGSTKILVDEKGAFYNIADGTVMKVTKLDVSGQILWEHSAPFGKGYDFRSVNGRLVNYFQASKSSLENLSDGKEAKADANVYVSLPVLAVWDEGKRSVFSLLSKESDYKEATSVVHFSTMGPQGILLDTYRQKGPSTTLVPIVWE